MILYLQIIPITFLGILQNQFTKGPFHNTIWQLHQSKIVKLKNTKGFYIYRLAFKKKGKYTEIIVIYP